MCTGIQNYTTVPDRVESFNSNYHTSVQSLHIIQTLWFTFLINFTIALRQQMCYIKCLLACIYSIILFVLESYFFLSSQ